MSGLYILAGWLTSLSCIYSAFILRPFADTELCEYWREQHLYTLSEDMKKLVIQIAFFCAKVYVSFRVVTLGSNIIYKDKYAIIKVRDKFKTCDLYVPYRKNLRITTRYEARAYKDDEIVAELATLPGIPLLISADELGVDELAYCMPSSGKRMKRYSHAERPVNTLLK